MWFSLSQCNLGSSVKPPIHVLTIILSGVSMCQVIIHRWSSYCRSNPVMLCFIPGCLNTFARYVISHTVQYMFSFNVARQTSVSHHYFFIGMSSPLDCCFARLKSLQPLVPCMCCHSMRLSPFFGNKKSNIKCEMANSHILLLILCGNHLIPW